MNRIQRRRFNPRRPLFEASERALNVSHFFSQLKVNLHSDLPHQLSTPTKSGDPNFVSLKKYHRGQPQTPEFNSDCEQFQLAFFYHPWDVKPSEVIMKEGLEGVVEFLLPELAFAGEQGESSIASSSQAT